MATKNRWMSIKAVTVILWTAGVSARATLPIVSRTASGTGTVQYVGTPSPVTDSASTNDPTIQGIAFRAQQDVEGQPNIYFVSHGQASMYVESALRLGRLDTLELAYYGGSGGTASGVVTSVVELDLPSDTVVLEFMLRNGSMDFPRTFGMLAENITDQNVLVNATGPITSSIMLTGHKGDRIRVLLEATMSGSVSPGSSKTIGEVNMRVWVRNVEDCNGNGQTDDQDELLGVGFDCNDNLILDVCDIAAGTSIDCNGNSIPDECETDCNGNGIQDGCDISSGTSADCNQTGVPDECEPPQPDCNKNGIGDGCDLADGTSTDCNTDGIPDDCQPDEDCNANGIRDICDIGAGTSPDCNLNLAIDSCDIASGTSSDTEGDGIPDDCQGPPLKGSDDLCKSGSMANQPCAEHSDCPGGFCHLKNRFVTAEIPPTIWNALKVTLVNIDANSVLAPANYNGTDRWVGAPTLGVNDGVSPPFNAAKTQCSFVTCNWSATGRVHIYGDVIRPGSLYDLRGCNPQTTCSQAALRIATAKFGDVISPLNVVNFQDVNAELSKFQSLPSGPSKTRAKLATSVLTMNSFINFADISACVAAFQGKAFKSIVLTPPDTCEEEE